MCILTVAVNAHDDFPLIMLHNRDEYHSRTATPLIQRGDILAAFDELSGGTWMGVNVRTGAVAALTNVRSREKPPDGTPRRSRGELVMRALRGEAEATASTTRCYSNYNLLHGEVCAVCGMPSLRFSVSTPADWVPRTQATARCACGGSSGAGDGNDDSTSATAAPFVIAKSNDHSGEWTTAAGRSSRTAADGGKKRKRAAAAAAAKQPEAGVTPGGDDEARDEDDECVWAKVAWLRDACERVLAGAASRRLAGEAGAKSLVAALAPLMSARALPAGPMADRAAAARPSRWSTMSLRDERLLHRAPFVSACELREEQATSGGGGGGAYGTVSQTAVIACRSERAIVYAYRETAAASGDDELPPWTWRRVELPPPRGASTVRTT